MYVIGGLAEDRRQTHGGMSEVMLVVTSSKPRARADSMPTGSNVMNRREAILYLIEGVTNPRISLGRSAQPGGTSVILLPREVAQREVNLLRRARQRRKVRGGRRIEGLTRD